MVVDSYNHILLYTQTHTYLSVLQLHGQDKLVPVIGQGLAVIALGEEGRAEVPVSPALTCLVTCKRRRVSSSDKHTRLAVLTHSLDCHLKDVTFSDSFRMTNHHTQTHSRQHCFYSYVET